MDDIKWEKPESRIYGISTEDVEDAFKAIIGRAVAGESCGRFYHGVLDHVICAPINQHRYKERRYKVKTSDGAIFWCESVWIEDI